MPESRVLRRASGSLLFKRDTTVNWVLRDDGSLLDSFSAWDRAQPVEQGFDNGDSEDAEGILCREQIDDCKKSQFEFLQYPRADRGVRSEGIAV